MGLTHGTWLLVKLGSHVVISCVHTKGPHTRKENQRIGGRNHLFEELPHSSLLQRGEREISRDEEQDGYHVFGFLSLATGFILYF